MRLCALSASPAGRKPRVILRGAEAAAQGVPVSSSGCAMPTSPGTYAIPAQQGVPMQMARSPMAAYPGIQATPMTMGGSLRPVPQPVASPVAGGGIVRTVGGQTSPVPAASYHQQFATTQHRQVRPLGGHRAFAADCFFGTHARLSP